MKIAQNLRPASAKFGAGPKDDQGGSPLPLGQPGAQRLSPLTSVRYGATKQNMKFIRPILAALHLTTFIASAEAPNADQVLSPAKAGIR